ncbi:MAG TPA: Crp/Fnr family transcriptional regulator [Pyrinomonadaceae bacterium]
MNGFGTQNHRENNIITRKDGALSPIMTEAVRRQTGSQQFQKINDKFPVENFLQNNLLAVQSQKTLISLLPFAESVSLPTEKILYESGDRVDYIYFPETAIISEFQILEDGASAEVAMVGNEGAAGLLALFGAMRATNWAQVSVHGKAYRISGEILKTQMLNDAFLQKTIFQYIGKYVEQISQRAVCKSFHALEQRLCGWLLMLQDRKKSNKLPLTHEQIARLLGVHRPSVTLAAQNLRKRKVVDYLRGNIIIVDRRELARLACGCCETINEDTLLR